jgi:hypothetical protein
VRGQSWQRVFLNVLWTILNGAGSWTMLLVRPDLLWTVSSEYFRENDLFLVIFSCWFNLEIVIIGCFPRGPCCWMNSIASLNDSFDF